ncbi:hypothetical protein G5V58_24295 [Nocardioides anomalus]|uniref:PPE domain-containing protein n=1 Tax=Nocardioides anomalus TaxID=2712223 RepID=A0A6G6WJR1_9ACTN|nr:hypothetical protein [Nocardioides anomalus]QIG45452.1 hypothetical protein G5V58_24295 [Nocardioides anomalus]
MSQQVGVLVATGGGGPGRYQRDRLKKFVTGVQPEEVYDAAQQWLVCARVLQAVAEELDARSRNVAETFGGESGPAAAAQFRAASDAMLQHSQRFERGADALETAATAMMRARAVHEEIEDQPLQRPRPPRRSPGSSEGREVLVLSQYGSDQHSYRQQSAEQEQAAAEATARMQASYDQAIQQMKTVHGNGDPDVVSGGWDGPKGGFDDDPGPGEHHDPEETGPTTPAGPVGPSPLGVGPEVGVPQGPGSLGGGLSAGGLAGAAVGGAGVPGLGGLSGLGAPGVAVAGSLGGAVAGGLGAFGGGGGAGSVGSPGAAGAGVGRPPSVVATGGGAGGGARGGASAAGGRGSGGSGTRGSGSRGAYAAGGRAAGGDHETKRRKDGRRELSGDEADWVDDDGIGTSVLR